MEAFLRSLLPRLLPDGCSSEVHPFQGKTDLLGKLESRLRAYASWMPADWRLFVVVDRDDDDCLELKRRLEDCAQRARLVTVSRAAGGPWRLANRIAVEELEAWYFGEWAAVRTVFPRAPSDISQRKPYRDSDAVLGGTWEAFERIMQARGYFQGGLQKIDTARRIGQVIVPTRSRSPSFKCFHDVLLEALR